MPAIKRVAPQFLVSKLGDAIAFYEERLGLTTDFVYGDFYASVSRDGVPIHLKCAPPSSTPNEPTAGLESTSMPSLTCPRFVRSTTSWLSAGLRSPNRLGSVRGAHWTSTWRTRTATSSASRKPPNPRGFACDAQASWFHAMIEGRATV